MRREGGRWRKGEVEQRKRERERADGGRGKGGKDAGASVCM